MKACVWKLRKLTMQEFPSGILRSKTENLWKGAVYERGIVENCRWLLAVSEGVRALAGKAHSCNCSKNQEEGRVQKDEESGNEKSQEKQEDAVTIEQVRAVMASKSQDGKTQQVKALIQKYGADKLSGVQPEKYADLLRDAKAL